MASFNVSRTAIAFRSSGTTQEIILALIIAGTVNVIAVLGTSANELNHPSPSCC